MLDIRRAKCQGARVSDSLILEVANVHTDVLTGIYSEETGRPQPCGFPSVPGCVRRIATRPIAR
jgi:hypothetical protein